MHRTGARNARRASTPTHTADDGGGLRHLRLLVIDDDPQALVLVELALADAHFTRTIEVASTATEGLQRITAGGHDVYVVDHRLPDGTGIGLIHDAKAAGVDRPFILITGYGSGALDEAALREGAADYVEKHLLGAHLERAIRYAVRDWRTSRALRDREEQLRHAQKMEAIGRLAGGVAHDFNNQLTAIIGFTDLILERLAPPDPAAGEVREIRRAADRAAALTRQLLAFGRKQFVEPRTLDVNNIVAGLIRMLPSLIGEHIDTATRLAPNLWRVRADAGQMDQMLLNLVLNARDAMPHGGCLTMETANVELDEGPLKADGVAIEPGRHVLLKITDTGVGMDEAVRARAFEPFFTTKPRGKGTGLGLSTAYGVVEQSGGAITLESAPGRGTTVRVYLPVTSSTAGEDEDSGARLVIAGGGTETLLLVDDNESVRLVAAQALRRRGYTVYEARNAEQAIEWSQQTSVTPRLLVTDLVMPGMGGPQLAARLVRRIPGLRVLYVSGYTDDDAVPTDRALLTGVPLLQKPFTPAQLAESVRLALDGPAAGA